MAKDWPSSFPPWRSRRRKSKGREREEIWRERRRRSPPAPCFFLSSPLFLHPPPPLMFFFPRCPSWRKWQVRVEQEVRRVHLPRRNVWPPGPRRAGGQMGADACPRALRWRPCSGSFAHPYFWFISDGCARRSGAGQEKRLHGRCSEGRNVCVFLAGRRKPCNNSRCAALWSPSLSCSLCFYF